VDEKTFHEYLDGRYCPQVRWYDDRAQKNRAWYVVLQWTTIALSVAVPPLVALATEWGRWVAVPMSGLVAVLTAGLKTFKFEQNWLNFRTTSETLRKEKYLYDARVGEYAATTDPERLFVERVESLISREHTAWVRTHKRKPGEDQREASAGTTTLP